MIYSPTGLAPESCEASRMYTHPHNSFPRGEPLAKFGTAAAHPTHPGGGEIYPPTDWSPELRESPRMPPHPHGFPPKGEPQTKFGPTAAHLTHSWGGIIYSPTGWAPKRWEASRMYTTCTITSLGGNPWKKLGQQLPTPCTRGAARFILQLIRCLSSGSCQGCPHTRTVSPLGGNPWRNLDRSPRTPSPIWEDPW